MKYELMTIPEVELYIPLMEKYNVSQKARTTGFLHNYIKYGKDMLDKPSDQPYLSWREKRELFIKRTLAAYNKNQTFRRALSLIAWAFDPNKPNV